MGAAHLYDAISARAVPIAKADLPLVSWNHTSLLARELCFCVTTVDASTLATPTCRYVVDQVTLPSPSVCSES